MESSGLQIETPPIMANERLRSLYEYWRALGAEAGGLPSIQSFDPLRLPRLMPNLWILEVAPDTHRFRMRLAGEDINAIYRRNIAGHYFSDVFERAERELMIARYTRALNEPCIVRVEGMVYAAAGRFSPGERLALPMLGRSGFTDTILGATTYDERLAMMSPIQTLDSEPNFYPVRAGNHRPPRIVGG